MNAIVLVKMRNEFYKHVGLLFQEKIHPKALRFKSAMNAYDGDIGLACLQPEEQANIRQDDFEWQLVTSSLNKIS